MEDFKKFRESTKLPDVGETVAFEDGFEVKGEKGKKYKVAPNEEFEVVSVSGADFTIKNKKITFNQSPAEFKANGGYLV